MGSEFGRPMENFFPQASLTEDIHLSALQRRMLDATPDCIKLLSTDGKILLMNRAGCDALGVDETLGFGMQWLPLLPQSVHKYGKEALSLAASGKHARFQGSSASAQGIVYWDNLLTPQFEVNGSVSSILCVSRDVTEKVMLEQKLSESIAREKLISGEMHHRIKNIFAIISGLIVLSEKEAKGEGCQETTIEILQSKIRALLRASNALFENDFERHGTNAPLHISTIIEGILSPYGESCSVHGSDVILGRENFTVFALFIHELATNSMKYGALKDGCGHVEVSWTYQYGDLHLIWTERDETKQYGEPGKLGFGTQLVDRLVQSARGTITRTWNRHGLTVDLVFPATRICSAGNRTSLNSEDMQGE